MKLKFTPVPHGTTSEQIIEGKSISVSGYYKSEDGTVSMPVIKMMNDFQWQWLVFIDRLFHPEKYEKNLGEDVPQAIEHLTQWFIDAAPDERKEAVAQELEELKTYIENLDEEMKPAAEIALREWAKTH